MRAATVFVLATLGGAGCKGDLNPAYCATHLDDEDCRSGGVITFDAPPPECVENDDCANSPTGRVCDTTRNKCVQCIADVAEQVCTAQSMVCGLDQKCHGCGVDGDCETTSSVCLPSGSCADETGVLYASSAGTGTGCDKAAPCSLETAVKQLTQARHIIKLTIAAGADYTSPPLIVDKPYGVQIIGTGATLRSTQGDAITSSGQNLEILGLHIDGTQGTGIVCTTGGTLTLRSVLVANSTEIGIATTGCNATIERSRFSANRVGGMQLTSGTLEVRNNIIDRNGISGSSGTENGNVVILNSQGRFVFNTVALNLSRSGGSRTGGIKCTSTTFDVKRNIIAANGPGGAIDVFTGCNSVGNFETTTFADVKFADMTSFKLTPASPLVVVRDDPAATEDCKIGGAYIDDFEGEPRPVAERCDVGADELTP